MDKIVLFSVIIPTVGRKTLDDCLLGLTALRFSRVRFEVILVNDNPAVSLQSTVNRFNKQINITYTESRETGPAAARNHGSKLARGKFLVFTDDDCVPAPDWLDCALNELADSKEPALAGRVINGLEKNAYAVVNQNIYDVLFSWYNTNSEQARFAMSNNLIVPSRAFAALNGFDADFSSPGGEDRDFIDRWLEQGGLLKYATTVSVYHFQELSFAGFLKKHYTYGQGACLCQEKKQDANRKAARHQIVSHMLPFPCPAFGKNLI